MLECALLCHDIYFIFQSKHFFCVELLTQPHKIERTIITLNAVIKYDGEPHCGWRGGESKLDHNPCATHIMSNHTLYVSYSNAPALFVKP
jgi:hypothetical protein